MKRLALIPLITLALIGCGSSAPPRVGGPPECQQAWQQAIQFADQERKHATRSVTDTEYWGIVRAAAPLNLPSMDTKCRWPK